MQVDIVRSTRRKKTTIEIDHNTRQVRLRVPINTLNSQITTYLEDNYDWIVRTYEAINKIPKFVRCYEEGESFLFLGKNYPLHISYTLASSFKFNGECFIISHTVLLDACKYFESFYKNRAQSIIGARVADIAKKLNVRYRSLRITSARYRWGSCNNVGSVNFSWRLIMAQPSVIDYVIIHEFCHLFEFNHSTKFWQLVEYIMPDYKIHKKWLADNSKYMIL